MQNDETTAKEEETAANSTTVQPTERALDVSSKEQVEKMRPVDVTVDNEQRRKAAEQCELLRREANEDAWNEVLDDDQHGDVDLLRKSAAFSTMAPSSFFGTLS